MSNLNPTHIKFQAEGKNQYAALKPNTTWTAAKETAKNLPAGQPVRRK